MSNITDKILDVSDIVDVISSEVDLTAKGQNYVGLCPFHNDTEPSFTVSPSKKIYKCFSCGEGGNVLTFVQKYYNLSFDETVTKLADKYGLEYKRQPIEKVRNEIELLNQATKFYNALLTTTSIGSSAREYLNNRKIDDNVIDDFKLGYSHSGDLTFYNHYMDKLTDKYTYDELINSGLVNNEKDFFFNRIMIPIFNESGNTVGFSGRIIGDGNPKYLNSKNSQIFNKSNILYNLNRAKRYLNKKEVFIVEGFFDVISLSKISVNNVVATMGTSFTDQHVSLLKKNRIEKVILTMDQDRAGFDAMYNVGSKLLEHGITNIDVIKYDGYKDIDEYLQENVNIDKLLETKINIFNFKISYLKNKYNLNDINEKAIYIKDVCRDLNKTDVNVQLLILSELSNVVDISVDNLKQNIKQTNVVKKVLPVEDNNNTLKKKLVPTNDDVVIKFCLQSKENCLKIKELVNEGKYNFKTHKNLFEYLYEFYISHDTFDIITYDEMFSDVQDNYYNVVDEIKKNSALDISKINLIFENNKNKITGRDLLRHTSDRR